MATRMFAEQGAKIIAADLNESGLNAAIAEIDAGYHKAILPVVGNVAVSGDVKRIVDTAVEHFGSLNVPYNNAGIFPDADGSVLEMDDATFGKVIEVNLRGLMLCCKHGIPQIVRAGGGSVINVASFVALWAARCRKTRTPPAKAPCWRSRSRSRCSSVPQGVRVNAICPGPILTADVVAALPE